MVSDKPGMIIVHTLFKPVTDSSINILVMKTRKNLPNLGGV